MLNQRISIIFPDNRIVFDGKDGIKMPGLSEDEQYKSFHAVQWYGDYGFIEHKSFHGTRVANTRITIDQMAAFERWVLPARDKIDAAKEQAAAERFAAEVEGETLDAVAAVLAGENAAEENAGGGDGNG